MKLVLYSSDDPSICKNVDEAAYDILRAAKRVTYVPSCSSGCEAYYRAVKKHFARTGTKKFSLFAHDQSFSRKDVKDAFSSEAIYLSGGNTFSFLKSLQTTGLLKEIKEFVAQGGILIGVSAGSIIMTPSIRTAGIPSFAADPNLVNLKRLNALSLVDFEFSPHAQNSSAYTAEMKQYSRKYTVNLYACADGGGIVVNDSHTTFVGPISQYFNGQKVADFR